MAPARGARGGGRGGGGRLAWGRSRGSGGSVARRALRAGPHPQRPPRALRRAATRLGARGPGACSRSFTKPRGAHLAPLPGATGRLQVWGNATPRGPLYPIPRCSRDMEQPNPRVCDPRPRGRGQNCRGNRSDRVRLWEWRRAFAPCAHILAGGKAWAFSVHHAAAAAAATPAPGRTQQTAPGAGRRMDSQWPASLQQSRDISQPIPAQHRRAARSAVVRGRGGHPMLSSPAFLEAIPRSRGPSPSHTRCAVPCTCPQGGQ